MTNQPGTPTPSHPGTKSPAMDVNREKRKDVILATLLSLAFCLAYQFYYGNYNLNMRDEGYLWYGVEQVLAGDVPLRDFQSYDPGRYYWCAWLTPVFGTGIVGLRAAVVSFSSLGLLAGLLVIRRFVPRRSWLLPAAVMLALSLFPRHKLFEPSIALIAVWSTTRMIEKPSIGRVFSAGLIVGLAAVFGRNHGLYLALSYGVLFLLSLIKGLAPRPWRSAGVLSAGVVLGYAPVLLMLVIVPGFYKAMVDAILSVTTVGSNIVAPYFWPWSPAPASEVEIVDAHWIVPLGSFALHLAYLLPVLILPLGFVLVLRFSAEKLRRHAGLTAAVLVAIPYTYHYAVRSDVPHLFQAIQPVLLGALGLAALFKRRQLALGFTLGGLLLGAILVALTQHPELKHSIIDTGHAQARMDLEIQGDVLRVPERLGHDIQLVQATVAKLVQPGEEIFILPTMPAYYPILGKSSPSWWIYMLWHNSRQEQLKIIADLKAHKVHKIITIARPFNRDPSFNLDQTNPILWDYILRNFKKLQSTPQFPMPLRIHLWVHSSHS